MLRVASFRRLVSPLSLLCLLVLAPAAHAQDAPNPTPTAQQLADQAKTADQAGKHEEALRLYNQALTQARQRKDQADEANTLTYMGNVYADTGQPQKALTFYEQALPLHRQTGNKAGEAATLSATGLIYKNTGQPQKGLEFLQQALLLHRQIENKNGEANTLSNIGNVYSAIGQPQKALTFYEQALPLHRQMENKSGEAATLTNIGLVYANTGQPQKALTFYKQALPLHRQTGNRQFEANTLSNIGSVYSAIGQPQKGLEFLQQALPLHRQIGNKSGEAITLFVIGVIYADMGQPQNALAYYDQALLLHRKIGNKAGEAATLTNIGLVYANLGQSQKGLEFLQQALPLHRQTGNKAGEAATLTDMGNVYADMGETQKGLEFLQQALPLHRQVENKSGEAITLSAIGLVYKNTGQPQKALMFYEQTLPLHRQIGNKAGEADTLTNIGLVYANLGQPQKGLEFLQQALPLHRQIKNKSGEAATLTNIGVIYADMGQSQKAVVFYEQALSLHRQTGNKQFEANTLDSLGFIFCHTGQPQKGLEFLQQALPLHRQIGNKAGEANTLNNIASCEQNLSRPQQALRHEQQAVSLLEQLRANVGSQGDARSAFLIYNLYVYYHCLALLCQSGHTEEAFALTQKTKARSLVDLFASSRIDLTVALTAEEKQQLQTLQDQAENLNRQMLKEGVENEVGAKKRFATLREQLKQAESQLQTLTDKLYALHPGLADQQQAHTATVQDIASLLPSDTALMEYVQTSKQELRLFVVTTHNGKAQVRLYPIAINDAQLQKQCAAFRIACADPRKDPAALSDSLSRLLLSPARQELADKKRLIICPDGALWNVAFAALHSPANTRRTGAYLWQRYELSYAYSATGVQAAVRAHNRHKPAEHASVLAFANPYFGDSSRFGDLDDVSGQRPFELPSRPFELPSRPFELPSRPFELPSRPFELPSRPFERPSRPFELPSRQLTAAIERGKIIKSLPGAQQEADAIQKLFPDAAIYTGKSAQESVVREQAGKYKYLHFATHGFFNDAAPLLSCIVLAQPEQPFHRADKAADTGEKKAVALANLATKPEETPVDAEDGLLTARKVFGLHLNADLVTLSACNSGRGQVRTGEGIVGLTWAFFAAGCPSQVVSQWSVDDAATGQLMADFYTGLKAGQSKSAALRDAALKLSKDGKHSHPYYWSPFFLVGDWR